MAAVKFSDLINTDSGDRKKGYAPDLIKLFDEDDEGNMKPYKFADSVNLLRSHIENILKQVEDNTELSIKKFRIGKSHARRKKNMQGGGHQEFKVDDFNTWKLDYGINTKWSYTYNKEHYDGMVIITAITKETMPEGLHELKNPMATPQYYAQALQQSLVHHYMFEAFDERLANDSLKIGNFSKDPWAGVVYVAYKLNHNGAGRRIRRFFKNIRGK